MEVGDIRNHIVVQCRIQIQVLRKMVSEFLVRAVHHKVKHPVQFLLDLLRLLPHLHGPGVESRHGPEIVGLFPALAGQYQMVRVILIHGKHPGVLGNVPGIQAQEPAIGINLHREAVHAAVVWRLGQKAVLLLGLGRQIGGNQVPGMGPVNPVGLQAVLVLFTPAQVHRHLLIAILIRVKLYGIVFLLVGQTGRALNLDLGIAGNLLVPVAVGKGDLPLIGFVLHAGDLSNQVQLGDAGIVPGRQKQGSQQTSQEERPQDDLAPQVSSVHAITSSL